MLATHNVDLGNWPSKQSMYCLPVQQITDGMVVVSAAQSLPRPPPHHEFPTLASPSLRIQLLRARLTRPHRGRRCAPSTPDPVTPLETTTVTTVVSPSRDD
jgi:hypothetical protein